MRGHLRGHSAGRRSFAGATVQQYVDALRALPTGVARKLASWNLRWLVARDTPRAGSKRALLA
eukprot:13475039-Alexandrium_andersonii.AAC.1